MKGLIYLASPYSHPDDDVREGRFLAVVEAAAVLMREGHVVYSPIAHCHPIQKHHNLPTEWEYWERFDETILSRCDCLAILTIPGFDTSVGVTAEMQIAERLKLPLFFIEIEGGQCKVLDAFTVAPV